MAFDNSEISGLSLSKGSLYEEMTMTQAALDDSRLQVQVSLSNEQIHKDDKILNTYTVLDDAISGGMGSVWRVHHESWNTDLAMKRPQPRFFAEGGDARKAEFISECENWINLGLHPNIVSCYYVREIGGIPSIFSEWMDNGNLKERIRDGSLYEGTEDEVQARILDIAIQTARGLAYSHENGLIHQDIKPGNILLSKSWEAKIADFGLAKARSQLTEGGKAMSSGYTLEYCPKEQAEGSVPEPWMDIYAWALTVLEMFAGKRLWSTGADALAGIEDSVPASEASHSRFQTWLKKTFGDKSQVRETPPYSALKQNFSLCRISVPEKLQTFLVSCLEHKHENGMSDFTSIEQFLIEFYKESQGEVYVRPEPHAAPDTYFSLNNRAISMIDLGKSDEAYTLLKDTVSSNSTDFICQYNLALLEWKSKRISYQEFRDRVISARDGSELSESLSEKVLSVAGRDYSNEELKNKELLRWSREDEYVDPNRKVKADDASGPLRIWEAETGICLGFHHFVPDAGWFEGGRIIGVYQPDGPIVYMVNGYESPEYIPLPVPGICFPFAPERIQTSHEINGELERLKKSYFQALEAYECGNYEDVRRILAPYCASNIIVQHEEAALLWSKLHQYYEADHLLAVVPTKEAPSPAPSAFRAVYGNLSSGKNKADNGIVFVKAKLMLMQEHEGNTGDLYCDLEWSLTGYDSRNNTKEVFHIPYFAYETQFDEDEWDTSLYLSFDEEGKLHWSSYKQGVVDLRDAEYQKNTRGAFTMSGNYGMTFYLPGGSTLQNTQEGLKIGNVLLDDEFTGCYPLWNADILQCRKNNYLLLFTYGEKQKEQ